MKNLEHLLTEANSIDSVDELFKFVDNMIEQYTAGKQVQHRRVLSAIAYKHKNGVSSKSKLDTYARRELMRLIGNVCLETKVIKV